MDGLKRHPAASIAADVLEELSKQGKFGSDIDPASLVTLAMRREIRRRNQQHQNPLVVAEGQRCYPDVAVLGRVIDADTRLVVVDPLLRDRIIARERVSATDILSASVQIWTNKIDFLALEPLLGRREIYWWPHVYDASFLGYMEGALRLSGISSGNVLIV